jgi:acetyl/propionyl-CoA carboxylase alpha subunit
MYLEKLIEEPRHIEIKLLVILMESMSSSERDCSVQRRHQN